MPQRTLKAIIFDMDGVLVNSEPHHIIIEKQLFARLNLTISAQEHASYLGKSSLQMWSEIIRKHNLDFKPEDLSERNSLKILEYFSGLNEIELMPGIVTLLEEFSASGIPMAVASSSDIRTIEILLSRTGISNFFLHKVSSETIGKSKPEPDIYLYTARLLSVDPEECLVVEDSENGIKAAKAAGMTCVAYNGICGESGACDMADESIGDFSELPGILRKYRWNYTSI
jgi:beta-phosphoglucomutase